jgi:Na+/phosphate symporter
MRLLDQQGFALSHKYPQTVRHLQKLTDGHRDIVLRAYTHVINHHKGLLPVQIGELEQVRRLLDEVLLELETTFGLKRAADIHSLMAKDRGLRDLATELNARQVVRIKDNSSKTRLSILYYAMVGNAMLLSRQSLELLEIFEKSFGEFEEKGAE